MTNDQAPGSDLLAMGAEDFAYVLEQVPGSVAVLGACQPGADPRRAEPLHSPRMVLHEDAMATGIALYAKVAMHELGGEP